jgi:hypothetical protein
MIEFLLGFYLSFTLITLQGVHQMTSVVPPSFSSCFHISSQIFTLENHASSQLNILPVLLSPCQVIRVYRLFVSRKNPSGASGG